MPGDILIDGVPMEDGDKFILGGLDTLDQKKDFYYVYFRIKSNRGVVEGGHMRKLMQMTI